jgi:DeoR/GlpR family transcriptional regulator of sugar metabolism
MFAHERQRFLLQRLEKNGSLQVRGLHRELDVTVMTLWRDLDLLERQGLLKRVHGGVLRADRAHEPAFRQKQSQASAQKRRIAKEAVRRFVKKGDTVILEGGTTVAEILPHLPTEGILLLTNSLPILSRSHALGRDWEIQCSGGTLSPVSGNFTGQTATRFFHKLTATTFFMSATGLDPETGTLTDPNPLEIEVKRAMAATAQRVVLLLDSRKIGQHSAHQVLPLRDIDDLVIDRGISAADRRRLASRRGGPRLHVC